ncbi:hypothetical protein I79_019388 [Cricetulus griseus]|uniref:Uncharacterized protein n=1 Tax=Cricetulus griseus TaxID=10029 RepID=G3I7A1_CRIGR|nr:hypothetical protein I79_019388 [Cricetulus griseus]
MTLWLRALAAISEALFQFPALTRQLTTVYSSIPGIVTPSSVDTRYKWYTYIYTGKTLIHRK